MLLCCVLVRFASFVFARGVVAAFCSSFYNCVCCDCLCFVCVLCECLIFIVCVFFVCFDVYECVVCVE